MHAEVLQEIGTRRLTEQDRAGTRTKKTKVRKTNCETAPAWRRGLLSRYNEFSADQELIETFRTIPQLKQIYPAQSIRQYIISGAESEDDVLNVLRLAKACGVVCLPAICTIDHDPGLMPVPLFESIDSLRAAGGVDARVCGGIRISTAARFLGTLAGSHAGLLRLQQRRRNADQHLGAVQGASRSASRSGRMRSETAAISRPRRHGGTRRWADAFGNSGAAGRLFFRAHPHYGAGRSPQLEVCRSGAWRNGTWN